MQEGALVAVIGAVLAFAANGLSPRGLLLTRDYFPGTKPAPPTPAGTNVAGTASAKTNSPLELLAARLRETGCNWRTATRWRSFSRPAAGAG